MTNEERLLALLDDPYYKDANGGGRDVGQRFESGDLKVEMAEPNWPESWYKDPYFNVSVPVALDLAKNLPAVKVFKVWYFREQDFHHIEFECDGDTYIVQWYKIFTVHRKSDGYHHYFDSRSGRYDIPGWFRQGKHKTSPHWSEGSKTFNPFQQKEEKES